MTVIDTPPQLELLEPPPDDLPDDTEPTIEVEPDNRPPLADLIRPAAASALVAIAAGFEVGGIFGSWFARGLAAGAAVAGAVLAVLAQRSRRRDTLLVLFPFILLAVATASLVTAPGGPASVVSLVRKALRSGSLLQPPVPFDPGWRVVLIVTLGLLGFAGAWLATALGKSRLGLALGLPVIGLTAITQPEDAKLIAGAVPIALIIAALALLFGGDVRSARDLGRAFEAKRAARALAVGLPLLLGVVLLNKATFLFPKPVYDPVSSAQKPRLVSAASDDVLFEVRTKTKFTGPWRVGVLDTYKDDNFLLPPQDDKRLADVSGGKTLPGATARPGGGDVTLVLHNLGDTPILPSLAGTESVTTSLKDLYVDQRTGILRITSGRLPVGLEYTLHVPPYATTADLREGTPATGEDVADQLEAPAPPPAIADLLAKAPTTSAFDRMQYVQRQFLDHVTAKGEGIPVPVSTDRVQDMLAGSKIGSPFEIVAAQVLIARWSGIPGRVGFGYDGVNQEDTGVVSVRPRNAADWLEVNYEGFGWLPLIAQPKRAQQDLDSKPKKQQILANGDIAVQVFVPYELVTAKQLYQVVRYWLLVSSPFVLLLLVSYLGWPTVARARRRAKRRRWAAAHGPAYQVAVEYAEMRDTATDLNVGDLISTPLEYLYQVAHDDEHAELAWLTTRVLYGDLMDTVSADHVLRAEEMSRSVRRRLMRAQPVQSQFLAAVSRASLRTPYEPALPNVRVLRFPRPFAAIRRWTARRMRALRVLVGSLPRLRRRMSV
jgi:hypothetical protein